MSPRYKILVVDDDPEDRQLLAEDLREMGCDPVFAMDGVTAIRVARDERPDVIILDVNLPAGSGVTVLERLRSMTWAQSIPVIVLSGQRSDEIAEQVMRLGATAYVQKSFAAGQLRAELEKLIGRPQAP